MKRTLYGYIKERCRQLSGIQTRSLSRLVSKVQDAPELAPYVFILSALEGKEYYLLSFVWNTPLEDQYNSALHLLHSVGSVEEFLQLQKTPKEYRQIYEEFVGQNSSNSTTLSERQDLQRSIAALVEEKGINRYGLCKSLGLNLGNVYSYLSGDPCKLSMSTALRLKEYIDSY